MSLSETSEMTAEEFNATQAKQRPGKYRAVPTVVDGIRFASQAEARRYGELKLLQSAGEICCLDLQPRFYIVVNGAKIGTYVADFKYLDKSSPSGDWIIEDVKGVRTPLYRWKKKLVEAIYGIEIREVS